MMEDEYTVEDQTTEDEQKVSSKTDKKTDKSNKQTRAQKRKMHSIRFTLIMMVTIPAVVTMLVTVLYARSSMTTGMQEEMIDGLVLMAESIKGGYNETSGDYTLGDDGCIYKGDKNITPTPESMDIYTENLDADVTLCWGKTRTATTITQDDGSRATGTDIADDVWSVVQTGETYKTNDIEIMGEAYYGVYLPLENEDGSVSVSYLQAVPVQM